MHPSRSSLSRNEANEVDHSRYSTEFHKGKNLWVLKAFSHQGTLIKCKVGKRIGIG